VVNEIEIQNSTEMAVASLLLTISALILLISLHGVYGMYRDTLDLFLLDNQIIVSGNRINSRLIYRVFIGID